MRVVAGSAGGLALIPPPSQVRPTMDRVREAMFSSLGEWIADKRVLDLFSGSGSVGIEALSRGAASVAFVESQRTCAEAIRKNLAKTGLSASLHNLDVFRFLERRGDGALCFDLIFADPPYHKSPEQNDDAARLLRCPRLASLLCPDGLFLLETWERWKMPADTLWQPTKEKKYGGTRLWYLEKLPTPPGDAAGSFPELR